MATPTSAIDDLRALLSPEEQVILGMLLKNDKAKLALDEGLTMRKEYLGDGSGGGDDAAASAAAEAARVEAARVEAADLSAITRQLADLNTSLTKQLDDFKKTVVTVDKLPEYRGELLTQTIKLSHEVARLEMQHKAEFGEELNLDELNTYVEEQKKVGRSFASITKAYEDKMSEKRVAKKIADGIADGLKNKRSADASTGASGGGGGTALSAGQELIRKAKGEAGAQDHIVSMADKLRQIREARESREGGAEAAS
jgi:hypothetical protein